MYKPFIFKLSQGNLDFMSKVGDDDITLTDTINQPLFSLGFHAFLHRTKNSMNITKNLESDTKFYYIVLSFYKTRL